MNNLLTKCLKELEQENPRLDYVRGILETAIEMNIGPVLTPPRIAPPFPPTSNNAVSNTQLKDEASILDSQAKAMLAKGIPSQVE